ncbi:DUF506 family protein [Quillaja saponaria]|uniref:DUF506 family protein n=1 Tax=Quillaja saponaria TaxID=32244 RepID=A0AAD7LP47_QUISA|nr:DUF506 family protein [Quillaja saponaria]
MVGFVRRKRVTDPLARLVGIDNRKLSYSSSGSEHSAAGDGDDSLCLSELVHEFLEDFESENQQFLENDFDSEPVDSVSDFKEVIVEDIMRLMEVNNIDSYRNLLTAHVLEAMEMFSLERSNGSVFRRNVMSFLRRFGHNAAICKTKWDNSGGITAGNYEFIDVVQSGKSTWENRYFVDVEFAAQFEIARPTSQYSEVIRLLPDVFVGTGQELKRIVKSMCDVAKKSFKSTELSVPPWRKNRYMQNKWFAPYRRTMNPVQSNTVSSLLTSVSKDSNSKCRFVGFNGVVSDVRQGVFFHTGL